MADFTILGHLDGVRYTKNTVIVTVSERSMSYRRKDGTKGDDPIFTWQICFKQYFRKFIAEHFAAGMLVKIKGRIQPVTKEEDGGWSYNYTVLGETINLAAYPSINQKKEQKLVKDSLLHDMGTPNAEEYMADDF